MSMWHQNDSSKHFGFVLLIKESAEIALIYKNDLEKLILGDSLRIISI